MKPFVPRTLATTSVLLISLALGQGVAHAASVGCSANAGDVCSTGQISANPSTHSLQMFTQVTKPGATSVTCVVFDNHTWVTVGRLVVTTGSKRKTIPGLYGTYTMGCYVTGSRGGVYGSLSNA